MKSTQIINTQKNNSTKKTHRGTTHKVCIQHTILVEALELFISKLGALETSCLSKIKKKKVITYTNIFIF
jgi:hypothetical protein